MVNEPSVVELLRFDCTCFANAINKLAYLCSHVKSCGMFCVVANFFMRKVKKTLMQSERKLIRQHITQSELGFLCSSVNFSVSNGSLFGG